MALNQIVKIPAEQASFSLGGQDNNVDFTLPGGSIYNLSESYVNINLRNEFDIQNGADRDIKLARVTLDLSDLVDGTAHSTTTNDNSQYIPTMASLVKNAYMSSQNGGKISDLRRCDKYNFVKSYYKKSTEDNRNSLGKFSGLTFDDVVNTGSENEFNKIGNEVSRFQNHAVRIPLSDVIPYCRIKNHNGMKEGDTRIHLELNLDKLKASPSLFNQPGGNQNLIAPRCCGKVPADASSEGGLVPGSMNQMASIIVDTTIADQLTKLTTLNQYPNRNSVPFFVGMTIRITADHDLSGGGTNAIQGPAIDGSGGVVDFIRRTITAITKTAGSDVVTLTLDSAVTDSRGGGLAFGNNDTLNSILVIEEPTAYLQTTIVNIELVAEVVNGESVPKGPVVYETILSVEDNYPVAPLLNRVYEIPPMCKGFYIMFFKGGGLVSDDANLQKYRITIDNIEQSTSSVVVGGGVYKNNIERVFMNNGEALQSIRERNFEANTSKYYTDAATIKNVVVSGKGRNMMICQPTQFLQRSQKLQIELEAVGGNLLGRHIIYYDVVKQR